MSRIPKIVPWASTEEYLSVAEYLYSTELPDRKKGVAMVKAWRGRARVPVAIDATANLVEMRIADQEQRHGVSITQLRHMYNMAIIRFVNSIVDQEQRGMYAQSIAMLASRVGMPAWFVELRHAGTHEQIPSLSVLRSACDQAVQWLYDYYWAMQTCTLPENTMTKIRDALLNYFGAKERVNSADDGIGKKELGKLQKAQDAAMEDMSALVRKMHVDAIRQYIVPVLMEPGYLVPIDKKNRPKFPDCKIAESLVDSWRDIFTLFSETWGGSTFIDELFSGFFNILAPSLSDLDILEPASTNVSTSYAATLVSWIKWLLEEDFTITDLESRSVNIDNLVETCLRNPNYFTRSILKIVSRFDASLKKDLKPFIDYIGKSLAVLSSNQKTRPTTLKDFKPVSEAELLGEENIMRRRLEEYFKPEDGMDIDDSVQKQESQTTANLEDKLGRWEYVVSNKWMACPLGTIDEGQIPELGLPSWIDDIPLHSTAIVFCE